MLKTSLFGDLSSVRTRNELRYYKLNRVIPICIPLNQGELDENFSCWEWC